jgi:RimJ/RimL family protein N-acetyltransferase
MESTVSFRDFEERDIDFVYRCKNDKKLNSLIVGNWHPFTLEEAEKWVHGCMGEHDTYKFWAVCTNDEEKRIVGWVSLSKIDKVNRSACSHGIVIADPAYRNGLAWIESILFIQEQVFEKMGLNRIYGSCRVDHKLSMQMGVAMFRHEEGIQREAIFDNGKYVDIHMSSLLAREYFEHKNNGDYEISKVIRRLTAAKKNKTI